MLLWFTECSSCIKKKISGFYVQHCNSRKVALAFSKGEDGILMSISWPQSRYCTVTSEIIKWDRKQIDLSPLK